MEEGLQGRSMQRYAVPSRACLPAALAQASASSAARTWRRRGATSACPARTCSTCTACGARSKPLCAPVQALDAGLQDAASCSVCPYLLFQAVPVHCLLCTLRPLLASFLTAHLPFDHSCHCTSWPRQQVQGRGWYRLIIGRRAAALFAPFICVEMFLGHAYVSRVMPGMLAVVSSPGTWPVPPSGLQVLAGAAAELPNLPHIPLP